jgi:hypothetical protein
MSRRRYQVSGWLIGVYALATALLAASYQQPEVRIEAPDSPGPRVMEDQTRTAVIRDYLQAWQTMSAAFRQNQPDLLAADFVGVAQEKLASTIQQQAKLGIRTLYQDRNHDIRLAFYSPEGLSIQLIDTVDYDLQLQDHDKVLGTQHVRSRYVAVLSPTEVRWKVRVLQVAPVVP